MGGVSTPDKTKLEEVPQAAWDRLARRRVYFGHQSVGYNVLAGVSEILSSHPQIRLRLTESGNPADLHQPGLTHSKIGSNSDPTSKLQAFANLMAAGGADHSDAAFFKLCYADIGHRSDPVAIFTEYEQVMAALAARFPRVRFLHMTVPLTSLPVGPKQTLKKILGRPLWGYEHNRRREIFNRLMRQRYASTDALFDIAAIESTRPDGAAVTFTWAGAPCAAMYPGYTSDSGHLGELGRRTVAPAFLAWLAKAAS